MPKLAIRQSPLALKAGRKDATAQTQTDLCSCLQLPLQRRGYGPLWKRVEAEVTVVVEVIDAERELQLAAHSNHRAHFDDKVFVEPLISVGKDVAVIERCEVTARIARYYRQRDDSG